MLDDFVKDIVQNKTGELLDFPENELVFNPYITQRIISMFSPMMCFIINETSNRKMSKLDKKEFYKLLILVVPKQNKTFTKFLKKDTNTIMYTDEERKGIDFMCDKYKLSSREVERYIKDFDLSIDIF